MTNASDLREHGRGRSLDSRSKVFAALACLQDSRDQAAVLESIRDVAANVLGSEEVAVFKVDKKMAVLWLYWCVGIDPNRYVCLDVAREPKLQRVLTGEIIVAGVKSVGKLLFIQDPIRPPVPIFFLGALISGLHIFVLPPPTAAVLTRST